MSMSPAAKSIFVWGVYMIVLGLTFMAIPNTILPLLSYPETHQPWVRVAATVVTILGYYYIVAARHELVPFFRATIVGRFLVLVFYAIFVFLGHFPWELILLPIPDQFGALWTYAALRLPGIDPNTNGRMHG